MKGMKERLAKANGTAAARYGERVNALLRERYTLSEELSLLRRRDTAPEAFAAYTAFAEECKQRAKAEEGV
ncbi:MAG: hypothetical protein IJF73_00590 [Clostridia bacterium]|nr:hypothetical protein [Clostridia bacterium]